jgi:AcrR family transcriptional regulator
MPVRESAKYAINRLIENWFTPMADSPSARKPTDKTRRAIIEAALRGFGARGYAATSTREIAALARTNIASIAYHFGGKEGLRAACAEHIVATMGAVLDAGPEAPAPATPDAARERILALLDRITTFVLLQPEAGLIVGFMMREMADPSPALDTIYEGMIARIHPRLCRLWALATGRDGESEAVKLAVFAMVGQVVYFHIGRPVVQRRLGWTAMTPAEARAVAETVRANVAARIDADRGAGR